jgi:redox-sensitive bicupin YhaK (pirin superfamily)
LKRQLPTVVINMTDRIGVAARSVGRVEDRRRLGPDEQVDDKAMVFVATDPALTDPFLFLSEDWFSKPGFDWHPHRGIETVTTVLDGVLEHGDNLGNAGALEPGDVQWMTAGRGIIHRELAYRDEHAHTLQLWLNLPAARKFADTRYQDLLRARRPRVTRPGALVDVISGTIDGATGPARGHVDVQGAVLTLEPSTALDYPLPAAHRAFAYVLSGHVTIAGRRLTAGQTAWSDPVGATAGDGTLPFATPAGDDVTRVMVYSGTPLREPVAVGGPFVMNHHTEITQAFLDLRAGRFGEVPRQARLAHDR